MSGRCDQTQAPLELEAKRYALDLGAPDKVYTLDDLNPDLLTIEDLLDDEGHSLICEQLQLDRPPSKTDIRRFFQERLASDQTTSLGAHFADTAESLLRRLAEQLAPPPTGSR